AAEPREDHLEPGLVRRAADDVVVEAVDARRVHGGDGLRPEVEEVLLADPALEVPRAELPGDLRRQRRLVGSRARQDVEAQGEGGGRRRQSAAGEGRYEARVEPRREEDGDRYG